MESERFDALVIGAGQSLTEQRLLTFCQLNFVAK